ncbi:MAG TPA: UDP-N-acetylglucosamine 2-epimerase [Ktedonosporobacter sp.]|jgi:UDP-N-acetylglucosamine 2-epimerase (non-hydrolysing)|nr:UDP-N-acetylglucosamine 2-epimerase [Ktedonosporobacter sp.]
MPKIASLVGGAANLMKLAPIHYELQHRGVDHAIIDVGLYMKTHGMALFAELQLPAPTAILSIDSRNASYIDTIKETAHELAKALTRLTPDILLTYGDLNAVVAAALCTARLKIPLGHVEAGLRNHDFSDTEEINRTIADKFSHWLFAASQTGTQNLIAEGYSREKIYFVGNTIIDCLKLHLPYVRKDLPAEWGLQNLPYGICSFHRERNLESKSRLEALLEGIRRAQEQTKLVFLAYQETTEALSHFGLEQNLRSMPNVLWFSRLGYIEFLTLLSGAKFVLSDSSGMQDETAYLGIPCFTCLDVTHRTDSIDYGTNRLVGSDPATIAAHVFAVLHGERRSNILLPDLWDGGAASRIVSNLLHTV